MSRPEEFSLSLHRFNVALSVCLRVFSDINVLNVSPYAAKDILLIPLSMYFRQWKWNWKKSEKRKKRKAVIEQLSDQEKVSENVETEIVLIMSFSKYLGYIKTVRIYTFNILRNHNFVKLLARSATKSSILNLTLTKWLSLCLKCRSETIILVIRHDVFWCTMRG